MRRASNDDWLRDEATFYYATTAYECAWTYRRTLRQSAHNFWLRGAFPFIGAVAMTWAFVQSATDMYAPDYGKTHFGPVGGVFVLGMGLAWIIHVGRSDWSVVNAKGALAQG